MQFLGFRRCHISKHVATQLWSCTNDVNNVVAVSGERQGRYQFMYSSILGREVFIWPYFFAFCGGQFDILSICTHQFTVLGNLRLFCILKSRSQKLVQNASMNYRNIVSQHALTFQEILSLNRVVITPRVFCVHQQNYVEDMGHIMNILIYYSAKDVEILR